VYSDKVFERSPRNEGVVDFDIIGEEEVTSL